MHWIPEFIQAGFSDLSIDALWIVSLLLLGLTLILFISSLSFRVIHRRREKRTEQYEQHFYSLILQYLEGETSDKEIEDQFSGKRIEYSVFEKVIVKMLEVLEGREVQKLQELLFLSPIFDYHVHQLESSDNLKRIKACNYFSTTRLVNSDILAKLKEFLSSKNRLLVFSAASALMASSDVNVRSIALRSIVRQKRISAMALLEMFYKFHNNDEDQLDEETRILEKIIEDEQIPVENLNICLVSISELGYYKLASDLLDKIWSTEERWKHPDVLKALIITQRHFYHDKLTPLIRAFIYHPSANVREALANTFGELGGKENMKALYNLLYDEDTNVKSAAVKGLLENEGEESPWLHKSYQYKHLDTRRIVETINSGL